MPGRGPSTDDAPKKTIGRYQVRRVIGAGAMGRVMLARDPVLERDVAIKLLRDDLRISDEVRRGLVIRMQHEARAAARLSHPNLVTLHDMGEDAELGLYLVFEYVEGPTLKQRLLEGPLPPREAARLARDLGAALSFAHDAGILHRDIKPENVILASRGGKIADFGIARLPDSTLTYAGGLLGTPAYSAPETFRAGTFSPESDQFSLAATMYEAITGQRAFPGDDAVAVASRIASGPPDRLAASMRLPLEIDDVLRKALAATPADRYASCDAFGRALASALGGAASNSDAPRAASTARATEARVTAGAPTEERKLGQVLLGGGVVLVTAALLARAALHDGDAAPSGASPDEAASASATPPAPPPPRARPTAARSAKPRASAEPAIDDLDASAPPSTDAGAPGDAGVPDGDGAKAAADAGRAATR
jgi:serine/threonine-protein kinase